MKRLLALTALAFTVEASAITGDLNLDGVVDFDDFFIFADNFGKLGPPEVDVVYDTLTVEIGRPRLTSAPSPDAGSIE